MAKGIVELKKELETNAELMEEINSFVESKYAEGKSPQEIAAEAVSILEDKGLSVTEKDLLEYMKREVKKELDLEDLEAVSGGGCLCDCVKECVQKMC